MQTHKRRGNREKGEEDSIRELSSTTEDQTPCSPKASNSDLLLHFLSKQEHKTRPSSVNIRCSA